MDNYPKAIEQLLLTLNAMLADSVPDETAGVADYATELDKINEAVAVIKGLQGQTAGLIKVQKKNKEKSEQLAKTSNTEELKKLQDQYEEVLDDFELSVDAAFVYRDAFDSTKAGLGDFSIPGNIKLRQNEIKQL